MADVNQVVFADVSSLAVSNGGGTFETATAFQASRASEQRPVYSWGESQPHFIISTPGTGQGSFTYIPQNATEGKKNWRTILNGSTSVTVTGGMYSSDGTPGGTQTLTFVKCGFAGSSMGMNAKNEMQVTVNFSFGDGSTF